MFIYFYSCISMITKFLNGTFSILQAMKIINKIFPLFKFETLIKIGMEKKKIKNSHKYEFTFHVWIFFFALLKLLLLVD